MPLSAGFYGTNANGSDNVEYCKFCFVGGSFVSPKMTTGEMIEKAVEHLMTKSHLTEERARELARTTIPKLRRWRT